MRTTRQILVTYMLALLSTAPSALAAVGLDSYVADPPQAPVLAAGVVHGQSGGAPGSSCASPGVATAALSSDGAEHTLRYSFDTECRQAVAVCQGIRHADGHIRGACSDGGTFDLWNLTFRTAGYTCSFEPCPQVERGGFDIEVSAVAYSFAGHLNAVRTRAGLDDVEPCPRSVCEIRE